MTKQQLLALLRYTYNKGNSDALTTGYDIDSFIAEIERTNRVGDLELPVLPDDAQCEHEYVVRYDHGTCKKCGWIFTDGCWGTAKRMWFKSLDDAKFYKQHGRLPQPPEGL